MMIFQRRKRSRSVQAVGDNNPQLKHGFRENFFFSPRLDPAGQVAPRFVLWGAAS
jgi:hypothetical protein